MSANLEYFKPLEEDERLAYLQAMDISVWVLRDEPLQDDPVINELIVDDPVVETNVEESLTKQFIENDKKKTSLPDLNSEPQPQVNLHEINSPSTVEPFTEKSNTPLKTLLLPSEQEKNYISNCFLKMVNWQSKTTADKSLLIICRHQIDQPAQSFARPNGPSQFMSDYIQAINELIVDEQFDIQVKLAHLSEAGLGNDNKPLQNSLNEINPDLILLLGDESIKLLFNSQQDVAQLRGKLQNVELPEVDVTQQNANESEKQIDVKARPKILVSYHPYTLIENPPLKKLALEDISLLIKILKNT